MKKETIKTALIGYGHLGRYHAQKCQASDLCDFVALVDPKPHSLQQAKELYPQLHVTQNIREILPQVQALVIALSHFNPL